MRMRRILVVVFVLGAVALSATAGTTDAWRQYRGPDAQGKGGTGGRHAYQKSTAADVPSTLRFVRNPVDLFVVPLAHDPPPAVASSPDEAAISLDAVANSRDALATARLMRP